MHTMLKCVVLGVYIDQFNTNFNNHFNFICRDFMHIVLVHYLETKVTLIWCTHFLCA
jgi:hypothetical protein